MAKAVEYLRKNWGAPFIILFILLLLFVAVELSIGSAAIANDVSVYAFYFLAAGVILQIAAYVKFRKDVEKPQLEVEPQPSAKSWSFSRRNKLITASIVIVLIVVAAGALSLQLAPGHTSNPLAISVNYMDVFSEPGNVTVVAFTVTTTGGVAPYTYSALWPDGQVQDSSSGAFSRTFTTPPPGSVSITVDSSDGKNFTKSIAIPAASTTSTASSPVSGTNTSASSSSTTISRTTSGQGNPSGMNLSVGFTREVSEPGGNTTLLFGVSVLGGQAPYNYVARWSDGFVQSSTDGIFSRTFTSGQTISASVLVMVISGDGLSANTTVTFSSNG